jgi:hypothetical protein
VHVSAANTHLVLHKHPVGTYTRLAAVAQCRQHHPCCCQLQVCIIEHNEGCIATQLQRHTLHSLQGNQQARQVALWPQHTLCRVAKACNMVMQMQQMQSTLVESQQVIYSPYSNKR